MKIIKPLLIILLITGCASANVVSSEGGIYILRVKTTIGLDSPAIVADAVHRKAAKICPNGWEKLGESFQPREYQNPLFSPNISVEWRIRCN